MKPADLARVFPSKHAIRRFVERGGATTAVRAEAELLRLAHEAREVKVFRRKSPFKGRGRLTYWRAEGPPGSGGRADWILAIGNSKDGALVIVTVYQAKGQQRWW